MFALLVLMFGLMRHQAISGVLLPDYAHTYAITGFTKDSSIIIDVRGDYRGNLDCYVIRNRAVVASDDDKGDTCALQARYVSGMKLMIINNGWATDKFSVVIHGESW